MKYLRLTIKGPFSSIYEGLTEQEIKDKMIEDGAFDPAYLEKVEIIEEG